ncbi:MAG TPA: phosphoribosylformylglycinamidine synthase subunit PurL [Candidatus Magasanikbacteria bacterium]|nr:phosphoribosylformylglycinamidine synthase subunit PurL [Candidatus Magasanikbacteria bacterium]
MLFTTNTINFSAMSESQIKETLAKHKISLTCEEILKIQNEILKRPPSMAECVLWSIQGSEHSSYKSSRNHLKQFVTSGPNVILGPCEDAGIIEIARDNNGDKYGLVISHESHNHPSQIVPYEGAATGIGGNVRDVCCMGAKVIASADPLRFGEIKNNKTRWINEGVVSGIAGYGNPIGVPVIAGDIYYDESYNDNCLVNVVTIGVLKEDEIIHSRAPKDADGYDLILIGKPTDNSGFGGASFASLEMKEEDKEMNKGAVQEPNAFLKRHLLKSTYKLFEILKEKKLLDKVGFKDLGAGGIACASVELADASGYGAEVNIDLVHKGMDSLPAYIILCAETQERFMWVAHPDVTPLIVEHYNKTFALPKVSAGARASVIGKIRNDGMYVVSANGEEIINAKASDVTSGLLYDRPYQEPIRNFTESNLPEPTDYNEILLKILSHENVACRLPVYEQYDKQVQGITVIEAGQADAGVMQPFKDTKYPEEIRKTGVALKADQNPRYGKISPYWGAVNAVVESMRNVSAVGATPECITDCLCFGNPEKLEQMWEFAEGVRGVAEACKGVHLFNHHDSPVPVVSGNVSLYNESKGKPIAPSAIIACAGKLNDVDKAITMSFKQTDSTLFMIGDRKDECGGSVYYDLFEELGANIPKPDLNTVQRQIWGLHEAIDNELILSAHDISDGGVAITLAEMSFGKEIGFSVQIESQLRTDKILFSETGGFVIEVESHKVDSIKSIFEKYNVELFNIGKTTSDKNLKINNVVDLNLLKAKEGWINGLREKL